MAILSEWLKHAAAIVGEHNIITAIPDMEPYSHDEFAQKSIARMPGAVIRPANEGEIAEIVKLCSRMDIPVTVRGGGTGLSGGCVPLDDSIVLSMERLNTLAEVDTDNHTITLEAGVTLSRLHQEVEKAGLFFPPHPGDEGAFAGGIVATNAGGARAVKYGTVKRFVLGLRVVLADGRIVKLGGKFIKSSTGYNLLDLMIGSEGTLGIITQVTLALLPAPGALNTLVVPYKTVDDAIQTVPAILKSGIVPLAVEFVEHSAIHCSERLIKKNWPAHEGSASLMVMLDGSSEDEVLRYAEKLAAVMEAHNALNVLIAENKERQADILEIRSMLYESLRPGMVELFDICVPRSEISGHVQFVHQLEQRLKTVLPTYGHAADGNVHTHSMRVTIKDGLLGEEVPGWQATHEKVKAELYRDVSARNGVISGEHGIGLVKRDFLAHNLGEINVELMRSIKKTLDPKGILNPGKMI
ncbi:MAG: FAD-binding oxidoreductase [Spirochaetota bacterium]